MAYLFDTDAVAELLRRRPAAAYVDWLRAVPREAQFISAVTVGELSYGAYRSEAAPRHLENIATRILPAVTVLPFDAAVAVVFGRVRADLEAVGTRLDNADLQIAATALHHGLEMVTGNVRHFRRIEALLISTILADTRR